MARAKSTEDRGDNSIAAVAATLLKNEAPVDEQVDEVPTDEDLEDTDTEDTDEVDEEGDEPEVEETSDDEGDETQEGDEQPDDEEEDEEPEYLDISDDDLITVMVDGQEQELSIGDLKKAHSLGGATEKRLQEATELRKTAHAERTQMLERLAAEERSLTEALSGLDQSVFKPVIPEPSQELRRSNPEQYLRHQEAYQADQKRIADAQKAVQGRLDQIKKQRNDRLDAYAKDAGKILLKEIPELADEKKAPQMLENLASTAKSYGYTDQEIQQALDPRMFMLVRDAMRFRQMTDKTRERPDPTNLEGQKQKKIRRLRSGATKAKTAARQQDKQRKQVVDRARQSGKVQDVAATLLRPAKRG
jgi:hypothetical protein